MTNRKNITRGNEKHQNVIVASFEPNAEDSSILQSSSKKEIFYLSSLPLKSDEHIITQDKIAPISKVIISSSEYWHRLLAQNISYYKLLLILPFYKQLRCSNTEIDKLNDIIAKKIHAIRSQDFEYAVKMRGVELKHMKALLKKQSKGVFYTYLET